MLAEFDPGTASPSWGDIGQKALLDILRGLTGGQAATDAANKLGPLLNPGGAEAAAAAEARRQAEAKARTTTILVLGGLGAAVVVGVLLLRGRA